MTSAICARHKQAMNRYHSLDAVGIPVALKPIRRHQNRLYRLSAFRRRRQTIGPATDAQGLGLLLLEFIARVLHFAHAHHVVRPFDDHVHLNPTPRFGIRVQPRIDIGGDSGDSKRRLDLRDVPEANALEGPAPPGIQLRLAIVMGPVPLVIALAMLKELEIEKNIVVDQLIDGPLS